MNDAQWESLCRSVSGKGEERLAAFIIDSPWLPNWRGRAILDYFTSDDMWFESNRAAIEAFPEAIFLPGFWAEYGMCTEPSAFGARCSFPEDEFPFAKPTIKRIEDIDDLEEPDPAKDGLLPFVLKRMRWALPRMAAIGHRPRFSVSRGPLNVASFLMGVTELMIALKTEPERAHRLLTLVTSFLKKWHALQRELFPSIDGIMVLDDIVGFIGEEDFLEFAFPYLADLYSPPARVKLFHNDADCAASVKHYSEMGVNLYNPGTQLSLAELYRLSAGKLAILGSIPPRDVLASSARRDRGRCARSARLPAIGREGPAFLRGRHAPWRPHGEPGRFSGGPSLTLRASAEEVDSEAADRKLEVGRLDPAPLESFGAGYRLYSQVAEAGKGSLHVVASDRQMPFIAEVARLEELNGIGHEDRGGAVPGREAEERGEGSGIARGRFGARAVDADVGEGEAVEREDRLPAEPFDGGPVARRDELSFYHP